MPDTWIIVLRGAHADLEALSRACNIPALTVVKRESAFYLESSEFSANDDYNSIIQKADALVARLNGVCGLTLRSRTPIEWSASLLKADGGRVFHAHATIRIVASKSAVGVTVTKPDGTTVEARTPVDVMPRLIVLAASDPKVATVLELVSVPDWDSWVGLYRIFEVVESDSGGGAAGRRAIVANKWATDDEIKRFRFTANSFAELRKDARHGDETATHPPTVPLNPMAQAEAQAFLERILDSWVRSKP